MIYKQKLREVGNSQGFLIQKLVLTTTGIKINEAVNITFKKDGGTVKYSKSTKTMKIGSSVGAIITKAEAESINAKVGDYLIIEISKKEVF